MTSVPEPPLIDITIGTRSRSPVPDPAYPRTLHRGQVTVIGFELGASGEPQVIMVLDDDSRPYESTEVRVAPALARELAQQLTEGADLADRDTGGPASPPWQ